MKDGFMDEEEIINDLLSSLEPIDRDTLKNTPKSDLIMYHHGTGTSIRNHYRLWDEKNPFVDNRDPMGDKFADQVSQRIIERLWGRLQNG